MTGEAGLPVVALERAGPSAPRATLGRSSPGSLHRCAARRAPLAPDASAAADVSPERPVGRVAASCSRAATSQSSGSSVASTPNLRLSHHTMSQPVAMLGVLGSATISSKPSGVAHLARQRRSVMRRHSCSVPRAARHGALADVVAAEQHDVATARRRRVLVDLVALRVRRERDHRLDGPGRHGVDLLMLSPAADHVLAIEVKGTLRTGRLPRLSRRATLQMSAAWVDKRDNPGMAER